MPEMSTVFILTQGIYVLSAYHFMPKVFNTVQHSSKCLQ